MKKLISTLFILFCLFSGMKAFSQVVVSGGNLKAPIRYNTIDEMKKDYKKLKKAASKGTVELKFPVGSNLRTEKDLRAIFESVFNDMEWYITTENGENKLFKWDEVFAPYSEMQYLKREITVTDCIKSYLGDLFFAFLNSNNKFYTLGAFNLRTPTQLAKVYVEEQQKKEQRIANEKTGLGYITDAEAETERNKNESEGLGKFTNFELKQIEENERRGFGRVTNAQKKEILEKINALKTEYDKKIQDVLSAEPDEESKKNIEKGKEYESKKDWIYALYYYDKVKQYPILNEISNLQKEYEDKRKEIFANVEFNYHENLYKKIELEPLEPIDENQFEYKKLASTIESGKPGFGNYDTFTLYDNWLDLLKKAEKYFVKNPPYSVSIGSLKQGAADRKTRTFTYTVSIAKEENESFTILKILKKGLNSAWRDDWTGIPKEWPGKSIYWTENHGATDEVFGEEFKAKKSYLIDGVPLFEVYEGINGLIDNKRKTLDTTSSFGYNYSSNWAFQQGFQQTVEAQRKQLNESIQKMRQKGVSKIVTIPLQPAWTTATLYDVKLNLVDENGKVVAKGGRKLLDSKGDYEFTGITSEQAQMISDGKITPMIDSIFLEYGAIDGESPGERDFVKNLPEIQIK